MVFKKGTEPGGTQDHQTGQFTDTLKIRSQL